LFILERSFFSLALEVVPVDESAGWLNIAAPRYDSSVSVSSKGSDWELDENSFNQAIGRSHI
jgi:hypothetical protein